MAPIITDPATGAQAIAGSMKNCRKPLFFTGAGISTESGIPDFRGPKGIWKTNKPIMFQDFVASAQVRLDAWKRHFATRGTLVDAEPNTGHRVIAGMMQKWDTSYLITQNVDGLHQRAGSPSERVVELHGNATYAKCLDCEVRYESDTIRERLEAEDKALNCLECGGIIKTATISFGQPMPQREVALTMALAMNCDVFLCMGSSLEVFPAADVPYKAAESGARLIIVNNQPTGADSVADLVVRAPLGDVLEQVWDLLCDAATQPTE